MNTNDLPDALRRANRVLAERDAEIARLHDLLNRVYVERDTARKQNASMTDALKKAYADLEDMEIDRERLLDRLKKANDDADDQTHKLSGLMPLSDKAK